MLLKQLSACVFLPALEILCLVQQSWKQHTILCHISWTFHFYYTGILLSIFIAGEMGKEIPGKDYNCQTSFWYHLNSWSINFLAALSKTYEGFLAAVEETVHLVQLQAVLLKTSIWKQTHYSLFCCMVLTCSFNTIFVRPCILKNHSLKLML